MGLPRGCGPRIVRDRKAEIGGALALPLREASELQPSPCTQHYLDASGIAGVVEVADNPSEHRQFFSVPSPVKVTSKDFRWHCGAHPARGAIEVIEPEAARGA